MGAIITSQATRVKVDYNGTSEWVIEDYFYRNHVTRISISINNDGVEIVRIHFSDGQFIDAHFSNIDTIQALADATPVTIPDNATLLVKLLEVKDE